MQYLSVRKSWTDNKKHPLIFFCYFNKKNLSVLKKKMFPAMNASYILILTYFIILHDKLYSIQNDISKTINLSLLIFFTVYWKNRDLLITYSLFFKMTTKIVTMITQLLREPNNENSWPYASKRYVAFNIVSNKKHDTLKDMNVKESATSKESMKLTM